jgi:nucleotide-binding universal stress UspA family protein
VFMPMMVVVESARSHGAQCPIAPARLPIKASECERNPRCTCRPIARGPGQPENRLMTRSLGRDHRAPVIVAALDGSAPSRCTTVVAAGLIKRMGWRLALVPVPLGATAADRRRRLIDAASDERAGLIASPATDHGSAGGEAAACLALAACAPCPVLAVPLGGGTELALSGPVVCGIDGAESSAPIARAAARLALALGAGLELVHVVAPGGDGAAPSVGLRTPLSGRMWRALHSLDAIPPVEVVFESGDPAERLCALAESERGLLVIGAPANSDAEGEGLLAATVLTESHVPVAVVSAGVANGLAAPDTAPNAVAA